MTVIDEILAGYEALRPGQEAFYQDLHRRRPGLARALNPANPTGGSPCASESTR